DVGLVDDGDLLALVSTRVLEGEAGDASGGPLRDDLDRLDHAGDDDVLEPRIQALGVFANDHEVDVFVAALDARDALDRPQVGVEVERLAQADVGTARAAAHGGRRRPLQRHAAARDLLDGGVREVAAGADLDLGARVGPLPLDLHAGRVDHFPGRLDDLGSDSIAWDVGDLVCHRLPSLVSPPL